MIFFHIYRDGPIHCWVSPSLFGRPFFPPLAEAGFLANKRQKTIATAKKNQLKCRKVAMILHLSMAMIVDGTRKIIKVPLPGLA